MVLSIIINVVAKQEKKELKRKQRSRQPQPILTDIKDEISFVAYAPLLRPLPGNQGGGFRLTIDISEDQYDSIKELLNPDLKNNLLNIKITSEIM